MTQQTDRWTLARVLPDGHRLFSNNETHGFYMADDSGETPDDTDDGPLRLDTSRPLEIAVEQFDGRGRSYCFIPLQARAAQTSTPTDAATLLFLSATYRWPIQVGEQRYQVEGVE